jgi:hypothetical protein
LFNRFSLFRLECRTLDSLGVGAKFVGAGLAVQAVKDKKDNETNYRYKADQPPPAASAGIMQSPDRNRKRADVQYPGNDGGDYGILFEDKTNNNGNNEIE